MLFAFHFMLFQWTMSEQDLDEIVQITVEDFNQDDRTGKINLGWH